MSAVLKTITFSLETSSIEKAIASLQKFQEEFDEKKLELIESLTSEGEQIAKDEVVSVGAVYTSGLLSSVNSEMDKKDRCGYVRAGEGLDYAPYVEYGTGVVGASSSHPGIADGESVPPVMSYTTEAGETHVYTGYDSQGHGAKGWTYRARDEKFYWTAGYKARPFMYNTMRKLEAIAPDKAKEILTKGYSD